MCSPATSPVPIAERITAVADAGFYGLGLIADDLVAIRDSIGFDALRTLISDAGLRHIEIELLERWWIPRGEAGNTYDARDLLFEAADVLAPVQIKIGSENGPATPDPLALAAPLRDLAEQAYAHGTRVAIETMPFSAIATVPDGCRNRFCRGSSGGRPARRCLARLPGRHDSGPATQYAAAGDDLRGRTRRCHGPTTVGTLFEDTVNNRLLCGEGSFDLTGLVALLRDLGFDGPWGVEILSTSYRALPVAQALRLAAKSALAVL